jgi:hypothetical protein
MPNGNFCACAWSEKNRTKAMLRDDKMLLVFMIEKCLKIVR